MAKEYCMKKKESEYPELDDNSNISLAEEAKSGYGYNYVANLPASNSFTQKYWSFSAHFRKNYH
ncbi:MAG: hypothetical protein ACI8UX_002402 [Psychromonas sp.]|jgi:hypothetical protein